MKLKGCTFLILFFICCSGRSYLTAQTRIIDSLKLELNSTVGSKEGDTAHINLLVNLAYEFHRVDPEKGIEYGMQALQLAQKIKWKKGIATANNRIGLCYWASSDFPKALEYNFAGLKVAEEIDDKRNKALLYGNIGLVYNDQLNFSQALEYHLKALQLNEQLKDKSKAALNRGNIGIVYDAMGKYPLALQNYFSALKMYEELNDKAGEARNLGNIGFVYQEQSNHPKALEFYFRALSMNIHLGNKILTGINLGNIGEEYFALADEATTNKAMQLPDSLKKPLAMKKSENYLKKSIQIFEEIGDHNSLMELYLYLSKLKSLSGDFKESLEAYKKQVASRDSVFNETNTKKTMRTQLQYEFERREAAAKAKQEKKDVIAAEEAKLQRSIRNSSFAGLAGVFIFSMLMFRQRNKIKREKQRSDDLLLNILPVETAEELKETGTAQTKAFESVSILFTDFKNFTQASEKLSPQDLVREIDFCFSEFDKIVTKYGIEKIKTIGDAYMCVGGLPVVNTTHPMDAVNAGLEMQEFIEKNKMEREKQGLPYFELRVGIHTGSVVAGVVGTKKFAYDIWGDAVNMASRMESSGETGKVNISGSTYELIKDHFHCTHRGKIAAKNKGEIDMYFAIQNTE